MPTDHATTLRAGGKRIVRIVVSEASSKPLTAAVFEEAARDRTVWTMEQWKEVLANLDFDDRTIDEWLDDRIAARGGK